MERLRALYPDWRELAAQLSAVSVDDAAIRQRIRSDFARYGQVWCPHTATAAEAYSRLTPERRRQGSWVLVATAHPAKFSEIVEPLVGRPVAVPPALARLLALPTHAVELEPELRQLKDYLTAT
jgi:threonine synthase